MLESLIALLSGHTTVDAPGDLILQGKIETLCTNLASVTQSLHFTNLLLPCREEIRGCCALTRRTFAPCIIAPSVEAGKKNGLVVIAENHFTGHT